MSRSCPQWRGDIGACIAGALQARELDRLNRHLTGCPGCRAEYNDLLPVGDWLAMLPVADLVALLPPMPGEPEPGAVDTRLPPDPNPQWGSAAEVSPRDCSPAAASPEPAFPADRSGGPRPAQVCRGSATGFPAKRPAGAPRLGHRRRRRLLAVAATAAGAVAAVVPVLVSTAGSVRSFPAADAVTGVSGSAWLPDTPTGTQIDLTATGLPANQRCILVAVTPKGSDIADRWEATYGGSARITTTTAFHASQLIALRIETNTGVLLLSIHL
jgi:Putative zinc-finger